MYITLLPSHVPDPLSVWQDACIMGGSSWAASSYRACAPGTGGGHDLPLLPKNTKLLSKGTRPEGLLSTGVFPNKAAVFIVQQGEKKEKKKKAEKRALTGPLHIKTYTLVVT